MSVAKEISPKLSWDLVIHDDFTDLQVTVSDLDGPLQDPGLVRTLLTYQMTLMVPMARIMGLT